MSSKNDITGDSIQTKALSKQGRDNWDNIFRKHENKTKPLNNNNSRKERSTSGTTRKTS